MLHRILHQSKIKLQFSHGPCKKIETVSFTCSKMKNIFAFLPWPISPVKLNSSIAYGLL